MIDVERVFGSLEWHTGLDCPRLFFTGFQEGIAGAVHIEPLEG
jgi:hypothetical protein